MISLLFSADPVLSNILCSAQADAAAQFSSYMMSHKSCLTWQLDTVYGINSACALQQAGCTSTVSEVFRAGILAQRQ